MVAGVKQRSYHMRNDKSNKTYYSRQRDTYADSQCGKQDHRAFYLFNINAHVIRLRLSERKHVQYFSKKQKRESGEYQERSRKLQFIPRCSAKISEGPKHEGAELIFVSIKNGESDQSPSQCVDCYANQNKGGNVGPAGTQAQSENDECCNGCACKS